ncbi:hypothetical protein V6N13_119264 [Hibiscus sabdariffa]
MPSSCMNCGTFGHLRKNCVAELKEVQVWKVKTAKGVLSVQNLDRVASTSTSTGVGVHTKSQVNGHGCSPAEPTLGDGSGSAEVMIAGTTKNTFDAGTEMRCESVEPTFGDGNRFLETVVVDGTLHFGVDRFVEPTLGDGNRSVERVDIVVANAGLKGLKENVFPPLQASQQKKKTKGKGVRSDAKHGFAGSKNKFELLNGLDGEEVKVVPEGRKPRAASQGVAILLQEMKTKKKDMLEKIGDPSVIGDSLLIAS